MQREGGLYTIRGKEIRMKFVELISDHGLKGKVRANKTGCLDSCEVGAAIVIYPAGTWYTQVGIDDVEEIFETSILKDNIVDRLVASEKTWESMQEIRHRNQAKA